MTSTPRLVVSCLLSLCAAAGVAAAPRQHVHVHGGQPGHNRWAGCSRGVHYRRDGFREIGRNTGTSVDSLRGHGRVKLKRGLVYAGFFGTNSLSGRRAPWTDEACDQYVNGATKVSTWLRAVQEYDRGKATTSGNSTLLPGDGAAHSAFDRSIFSQMVFKDVCAGESSSKYVSVPIEPLVGHLRHPYGLCAGARHHQVNILDTSYLLINAWPPSALMANFPGRKYLLDMGSSTFDTSLEFFTKRYEQSGVLFDEVWAWEVVAYDHREYWAKVPDDYLGRVHFYNTAFSSDISNASHPLNIMRSRYRPGDMFILKLDIDNAPLELSVIEAIEKDPSLGAMIAEMFFEMHYDHADMAGSFGLSNGRTLADVKQRFTALRKSGLSLHFWP